VGLLREEECFAAEILHERGLRFRPSARNWRVLARKKLKPSGRANFRY